VGHRWQSVQLGEDRCKEQSSGNNDKDHPSGEVQSISELHLGSPKVGREQFLWKEPCESQNGGDSMVNEAEANFYKRT